MASLTGSSRSGPERCRRWKNTVTNDVPACGIAPSHVHVLPADVIHTGDIYEVGTYPFIDVWAGGSIAGMLRMSRRLLALGREGTRYVPGHGDVGKRHDMEHYVAMLAAVCEAVTRERSAGKTVQEVMDARATARFDDSSWGRPRHGQVFAALVFWSLERGSVCGF